MHTRNRLLVVSTAAALLGAVACNNDKLTSLNKNPNSPEDVPGSAIFTNAVQTSAGVWLGGGFDLRQTEFVAQHLAEVQYPDEDSYKRLDPGSTSGSFNTPYVAELEDYRKIIQKGKAANDPGMWALASIMRAWDFSFLTNTFGDVPYFQALQGDSAGGAITPKYDAQKDIYADLFKQLDDAVKALQGASNSLHAADPIYGGDPVKWQRFANSLRLRLALQLVNVDAGTTNAQVTAALAAPGGVFTSNSDNAQLNWPGDGVFDNPWSVNFRSRDDHRMSQTFMNIMLNMNDPRIPVFAQPTQADPTKYAGMPNGLTQSTASTYATISSRPGLIFWPPKNAPGVLGGFGTNTASYLMTFAEVMFLKAEAANRGIGGVPAAEAATDYNAGIAASLQQWGVSSAYASYIAQANVVYAGGTTGLTQIYTQEWIALFTDGATSWSLWRRTCVPATLVPGPNAVINTVPRRFDYSIKEYSVNLTQVNAAIAQQGPDVLTTRMYWDKSPSAAPTYFAACGVKP